MDTGEWVMLVLASIYFLFNIKKVYYGIIGIFSEYGVPFTIGLMVFVLIFIVGCIIGIVAPVYFWIPQWAFILFIIGFFVCRLLFGIPK